MSRVDGDNSVHSEGRGFGEKGDYKGGGGKAGMVVVARKDAKALTVWRSSVRMHPEPWQCHPY